MPVKSVTLGEIAKVCQVSRATVSRALRNSPLISETVRKKINRTALRMGYQPDPETSRLMAHLKRSQTAKIESTIGVLNDHNPPSKIQDNLFFRHWLKGVQTRTAELGYSLDEMKLHSPNMTTQRMQQIMEARAIRGLLIPPGSSLHHQIQLDWSRLTLVASTACDSALHLDRVLPNNFANAELMMQKALELGYSRIGLVIWPELEERQIHANTQAYARYAFVEKKCHPIPPFQWEWDQMEKTQKNFLAWFKKWTPDLILAHHDAVLNYLTEQTGRTCPDQIGFICYAEMTEGFSRLDERPEEVGRAAVDMLSSNIQHDHFGLPAIAKTMLIEGAFIPDGTTREPE